jgi:hypothetical protein
MNQTIICYRMLESQGRQKNLGYECYLRKIMEIVMSQKTEPIESID